MRCKDRILGAATSVLIGLSTTIPSQCVEAAPAKPQLDTITNAPFGHTPAGVPVALYTLRNRDGMEVRIATYGGTITHLIAPDRKGHYADIVLGYDSLSDYAQGNSYFGALIGRYGNRIANGRFTLNGVTHTLAINNGVNAESAHDI